MERATHEIFYLEKEVDELLATLYDGVPVVPIAIRGARAVLRDEHWLLRRGCVSITVSPPILPEGSDWASAVRLRDAARAAILRH
jgi:1-acyl-sn-glycerol-3-phosphate acyltransferase